MAETNHRYDVFISYSHQDADWVWQQLLPRLERAGLRVCIDTRDFEIGTPSLVNMERAVDDSRHTLLVLTPAWVESDWTDFESLLGGTSDPAGRRRKLFPIMLKECRLPSRIAMLTWADFQDPDERVDQFERLITQLCDGIQVPDPMTQPTDKKEKPPTSFRTISGNCYHQDWLATDLANVSWPFPPWKPYIAAGNCRRLFVVLEFSVVNLHTSEAIVGPFVIDDWMYEARWSPPMYSPKRDYRVFDLFTQQPATLSCHLKLSPKGTVGFRVEVFEDTSGPHWESSKSRYSLERPSAYTVKFRSDVGGLQTAEIVLSHMKVSDLFYYPPIHRWSDLLGEYQRGSDWAPLPQGLDN